MKEKINEVNALLAEIPYTTTIQIGKHTIVVDEPVENGGAGKGPKAHDLLLSALVSCTCVTVSMYATRKGWKVKEIKVDAKMTRTVESGIQTTKVVQKISFVGSLDEDQTQRLVEIAGRCPVHKTLSPAMEIVMELLR